MVESIQYDMESTARPTLAESNATTQSSKVMSNNRADYNVFTARRYASAVLAVIVCLFVWLSVCPSVCRKLELYKDG